MIRVNYKQREIFDDEFEEVTTWKCGCKQMRHYYPKTKYSLMGYRLCNLHPESESHQNKDKEFFMILENANIPMIQVLRKGKSSDGSIVDVLDVNTDDESVFFVNTDFFIKSKNYEPKPNSTLWHLNSKCPTLAKTTSGSFICPGHDVKK